MILVKKAENLIAYLQKRCPNGNAIVYGEAYMLKIANLIISFSEMKMLTSLPSDKPMIMARYYLYDPLKIKGFGIQNYLKSNIPYIMHTH